MLPRVDIPLAPSPSYAPGSLCLSVQTKQNTSCVDFVNVAVSVQIGLF